MSVVVRVGLCPDPGFDLRLREDAGASVEAAMVVSLGEGALTAPFLLFLSATRATAFSA